MIELLYLGITFLVLFTFYKLIRKSIKFTNYPMISIFFLIKFFIFAYIGTLIHIIIQGYYSDILYLNQFILSSLTLILFPLGMLTSSKIFVNNGNFDYHHNINYNISNIMYYIFITLFLLSIIVLLLFISKLDMLPIVAIFKGLGVPYAYELRSAAGNTFPGKYYRYAMFMIDLPFFLMIILFFLRSISTKWKVLFLLVLFFNIFVAVMDIQKAPVLKIFLILLLSSLFYYKKINWKLFLFVGFMFAISLFFMYAFFLGYGFDLFSIIGGILNRIFFAQIDAFLYHQEYINANGFLYGLSFPNPKGVFPFEHVSITTEVYKFKSGNWVEGMSLGSFPTVFYGDWYDNFGYIGALFSMFLLGFIIHTVDIKIFELINVKKSAILIAFYIYIVNFFGKYAGTSFIGIVTDTHLAFPIIVCAFLYYSNEYLLKRHSRHYIMEKKNYISNKE